MSIVKRCNRGTDIEANAYHELTNTELDLQEGFNHLLGTDADLNLNLVAGLGFVRIEMNVDATTRLPKVTPANGVTINGGTDGYILSGSHLATYLLVEQTEGAGDYIFIAQGATSTFSVEGAVAGAITTASIFTGGHFFGGVTPDGSYAATQVSSTGSGTGATFTVTVLGNTVTAVESVDTAGSGYIVGALITIEINNGDGELTAAVLSVDSTS